METLTTTVVTASDAALTQKSLQPWPRNILTADNKGLLDRSDQSPFSRGLWDVGEWVESTSLLSL
ncbi:BnaCnng20250D [Brassica napus]|uniref:BnaCnng20250D protein n=1 Tax=Brassica napus TaxID=3708 RepID=A0A078IPV6_BRANA|nr:BnaCnng20250D [Brassica napus]